MPRNRFLFAALAALIVTLNVTVSGCSSTAPTPLPTAVPNLIGKQGEPPAAGYQVLLVPTTLTVGANRFVFGILNGDELVKNAKLTLTFFDLTGSQQKVTGTVPAVYREGPDGIAAIYTAEVTFPAAGSWGVAIQGATDDGKPIDQKIGFEVATKSTELAVGEKAPAAKSPTLDSAGGDLKKLTSASKPNPDFYRLSLDQALTSGKPTLVLFSTPAFCSSRLCGPVYDVMNQVYPAYADQVNVVHVEVYKDLPNPNLAKPQIADAMIAWGLSTEPWTYLLDKNGVVVWRAEGLVTGDEVKIAIDALLKAA